jgi:hypothetical protein
LTAITSAISSRRSESRGGPDRLHFSINTTKATNTRKYACRRFYHIQWFLSTTDGHNNVHHHPPPPVCVSLKLLAKMAASFACSHRLAGINPPLPSSSSGRSEGSRLLTLIRRLERKDEEHDDDNGDDAEDRRFALVEECVEVLVQLVASCQRKGLLGEDPELADKVLAASAAASSSGGGRKRGRQHPGAGSGGPRNDGGALQLSSVDADAAMTTITSSALDVHLVLQGLVRVMTWDVVSSDQCLLMVLVGDYFTAASEYAQARRTAKAQSSRCHLAELELLHRFPLVTSLQSFLQNAVANLRPARSNGLCTIGDDDVTAALASCLRASASLVRLFTTRLSRTSLDGLAAVSWQALAVTDSPDVPLAAAIVLSTLPVHKTASADAWIHVWHQAATAIQSALVTLVPVMEVSMESGSSDVVPRPLQSWMQAVHRCSSEKDRVESFRTMLTSLVRVLQCLLGDHHPTLSSSALLVSFDVTALVDLVETILSFGSSAEAVFFGTKKRLRAEIVGSGAMSAKGAAQIANSIKILGLQLMSSFVRAVGGSSLLPFSDRLYRIANFAVRTSCSTPLRSAIDPVAALDVKNQRWLQCSVSARTEAIRTFEHCLLAFGCQINCASDSRPRDFDSTLTLVAGSVIEQLQIANAPDASVWGSIGERSELFEACARCVEAALVSSGEFLIDSTRLLLDSVIHTCLQALVEGANAAILASHVRTAVLSMGTAGVTTCWSNGSSSGLPGSLESAAAACRGDRNPSVALAASRALAACVAASTTRVPALSVVVPSTSDRDIVASRILTPDGLVERLEAARVEGILRASEKAKVPERHYPKPAADSRTIPPVTRAPIHKSPPVSNVSSTESSKSEELEEHSSAGRAPDPTPETQSMVQGSVAPVSDPTCVSSKTVGTDRTDDDDDDDDDFPMIVDADPDEDDVD